VPLKDKTKPPKPPMNRILAAGLMILLIHGNIHSQHPIQGVALKRIDQYRPGDTINIYGYREKSGTESFLIRGGFGDKYVAADKIRLLDDNLGYWQKVWLLNQAAHIRTNGWQSELRTALREDYYEYASQMEINGLVFRDEYLEDYLKQLIYILHPEALMKEEPARLNIMMIRAQKPETFVFNNGTIVITTGMIAKTSSEKELLAVLAEQTAHIVLDHNLMNLNYEIHNQRAADFWSTFATIASAVAMEFSNVRYGTYFDLSDVVLAGLTSAAISDAIRLSAGADFNSEQIRTAQDLSREFISQLEMDPGFQFLPDKEYMINISSALSLTAWQLYYSNNYDQSLFYIDRVFDLGIASEEDYLLRAKITRTLANAVESNLEALRLINTALSMNDFDFVEALAEKGLILIRLGEVDQARAVFEEYRSAISGMPDMPPGRDSTWANRMIIKCDQLMLKR
jgi:hypothetical protein